MNDELRKAVLEFVADFEEVFDKDWEYTKENLGIYETKEQKKYRLENPDEEYFWIHPEGTFINPRVQDEIEDWGHRGGLLQTYRKLKKLLSETE